MTVVDLAPEPVEAPVTLTAPVPPEAVVVPPLTGNRYLARGVLVMVAFLSLALLVHLTVVSRMQHATSQARAFQSFRHDLAIGTVPVGPTDDDEVELAAGAPVALIEIPALDLTEVVGEGTSSGVLVRGPGHRRDTPLPGQMGTSVVFGRRATYGGPFGGIASLRVGDTITATTGQGTFQFVVSGVRHAGDPLPVPVGDGGSRLTLATADGTAFLPAGVVWVDAEIMGEAAVGPPRAVPSSGLADAERAMGVDRGSLAILAFWLQALLALSLAAVWAWHRWHRAKAWVVCVPPLFVVGLAVAGELAKLLPNLI